MSYPARLLILFFCLISVTVRAGLSDDAESPVTTDAKWILLGGTALTIAVVATQDSLSGPWETRTAKERPLGKYSKYGDALGQLVPNAVYAGGMWTAYYFGYSAGNSLAWRMVEVTAYASLIATVLKYNVSEGRPYDLTVGSSFPSGHATTAFSFAGVIATEHGWYYGVPAMLMAAFVGYSRINDDQHRLHDVIGGATLGLTCAYGIHYARLNSSGKEGNALQILPAPISGGSELLASWNF